LYSVLTAKGRLGEEKMTTIKPVEDDSFRSPARPGRSRVSAGLPVVLYPAN
jgi:hypothetical protein